MKHFIGQFAELIKLLVVKFDDMRLGLDMSQFTLLYKAKWRLT